MSQNTEWTIEQVTAIYKLPFFDLMDRARSTHRQYHLSNEVQVCSLISIKTGACSEDCSYCPQSARYDTDIQKHPLLAKSEVLERALNAKEKGATRICMGAAWRKVRDNKEFDAVLDIVKDVNALGVEVCCTLGMLTKDQADKLKEAGLYAYNHNLDTSREYYDKIISTRTYDDRLQTLDNVRKAGIKVCCGGILGMGESEDDRIKLLHTLATLPAHPESVPINALVPVEGTPLQNQPRLPIAEMVRAIATARILMPKTIVRLSAGRLEMSLAEQAMCFMAGANSIFAGDKLLTTANPEFDQDQQMFATLGLTARPSYKYEDSAPTINVGAPHAAAPLSVSGNSHESTVLQ